MGRKPEGKVEKILKDLGKKIDELIADLKKVKGEAGVEFNSRVDELKRNRDSLENEFKKLRSDDRWKEVEQNLDNAGKDIRKAFDAAFKKQAYSKKENKD